MLCCWLHHYLIFFLFFYRLFAAEKLAKDKSYDIALFVAFNNQSSALFVINGSTGSIEWSLYSSLLLPVAPVSVPVVLNLQQAFIICLPKLEIPKLILRSREPEKEKTRLEGGTKTRKHLDKKVTKLLSPLLGSQRQRKLRDVHQARDRSGSVALGLTPHQGDVTDDDNMMMTTRDQNTIMTEALWSDITDDIPFSLPAELSVTSQGFVHRDTNAHWFARKVLDFLTQHRVDTSDPHPFENNERPFDHEVDSDQIIELEHELNDLTSSRNEKYLKSSEPKPPALLSNNSSFSLKLSMKQHHIRSSNQDEESNFPVLQITSDEDLQAGKLMAGPGSRQAHNKRSVQSQPIAPDCVRHLDDDSRSLVALLVTRDSGDSKQFVQVMEEKPFYLGKKH